MIWRSAFFSTVDFLPNDAVIQYRLNKALTQARVNGLAQHAWQKLSSQVGRSTLGAAHLNTVHLVKHYNRVLIALA